MRPAQIAIALALFTCPILAQTPATAPSFEVASVKPAAPPNMNGGRGGRGGRGSPGQVMFTNSSMSQLLIYAYAVKRYQISGPDSLDTDRYDIVAKLPEGAKREDSPAMLQTLLKERFGLAVHRETKELPVYSLVVAKNGPKMKEAEELPVAKDGADATPPMLPPPGERKMGPDGFPIMPGGGRGGSMQMQMMPGRMRMKVTQQTMPQLADMLTNQLDRRVTDQTGLTKSYDFILEFAPESGGGRNPFGIAMPMAPPAADAGATPDPDAAPGILAAVQAQLGLKLEPKKGPVELLVVDHVEKTPTEN